ncbi:hypothetical protein [Rhizobium sp. BK176]|uniref:hypothetical protein n=1 Tax=Rhizobium sp. BK176 TaxID=2587071 RepID=UPI00216882A3|nr:hypothetical protein [Rhizobium sp. BK176]MCS4088476.1 hypothetical protein [Rhizobium sp. BK176]
MVGQIESSDLWDRLEHVLGDEASILPPRPSEGRVYRFRVSRPFNSDWLGEAAQGRTEIVAAIESIRACAHHIVSGEALDYKRPASDRVVHAFSAAYEHASADRSVRHISAEFTATDEFDAISSAIRFWMGRQNAMPDFFGRLYSVKISRVAFGPINADGSMVNGNGFPFFEWKIDAHGMAFETYALHHMAKLIRFEKNPPKTESLNSRPAPPAR